MAKKVETKTTESKIELNPKVWAVEYNADLIAQVLYMRLA